MSDSSRAITTAQKVADYIVWLCQQHGDPISNLKLQKLLYYAQGWFLGLHGKPLFQEPLQAWLRGPVQREVWKSYSEFKWNAITRRIEEPVLSDQVKAHVRELLEAYGDFSALTLEKMTHNESPWKKARADVGDTERSSSQISIEDMKEFFVKLANGRKK